MINRRLLVYCISTSAVAVCLTACSNSTSPATTTTTTLATSDLNGLYVYSVSGSDPNDGDYSIAGNFMADGKGNITSAVADYNLGSGIDSNVTLTGTYTTSNGVATINLTDGGSVQESYFVPIIKTGTASFTRFDGTGSGTLYAPASLTSAPAGTYTATLSGEGNSSSVTDSAQFVTATSGTFTGGTQTYTDGNTLNNYSGVSGFLYPATPNGRGQAAIGANNFSYYVASTSKVLLIGLDSRVLLSGSATKQ